MYCTGEPSVRIHSSVSDAHSGGEEAVFSTVRGGIRRLRDGFSWKIWVVGISLQAANTHSNSHMHLNTFLPFVYAVSMVGMSPLLKLNIITSLLRLGMLMVLCSWWWRDIFLSFFRRDMSGETISWNQICFPAGALRAPAGPKGWKVPKGPFGPLG